MTESAKSSLSLEEIEHNKDLMDLKPNLDYVVRHLPKYEASLQEFLAHEVPEENVRRLAHVEVANVVEDDTLQLSPQAAVEVLSHLPAEILRISGLKELNYQYQRLVPIPNFNEEGFVDSANACSGIVSADTFPIEKNEDGSEIHHHPTRILIGNTYQGVISPSYLPKTVGQNKRAVEMYQIHVLLHEFFHTISEKYKTEEAASKLIIHFQDGTSMSFAEWRKAFIDSMLKDEPVYTSSYAATYADQMKPGADLTHYGVEEQLCETFSAYILGRAPGKVEYDDFAAFDFGNKHPERQLLKGYGSIRHELMDKFYKARFEGGY